MKKVQEIEPLVFKEICPYCKIEVVSKAIHMASCVVVNEQKDAPHIVCFKEGHIKVSLPGSSMSHCNRCGKWLVGEKDDTGNGKPRNQ